MKFIDDLPYIMIFFTLLVFIWIIGYEYIKMYESLIKWSSLIFLGLMISIAGFVGTIRYYIERWYK